MDRTGHPPSRPGGPLNARHAPIADAIRDRLGPAAEPPSALLERVRTAFGAEGFAMLAAPADAAGVAAVLEACTAAAWPVAVVGSATWPLAPTGVRTDHPALRCPVVLSTARLNRIVEHEPADLVVGVQAGMPLERLNAALAEQRQWLPLDPPAHGDATVGAVAALASAGPLRAGHGTPRDLALGVELATGDGRLLRFGGRVVKNVAGYDGVRLAIGSRGRLGVVTQIFLKVSGRPRADVTLALACGAAPADARRAVEVATGIRGAVGCDALEVAGPELAERLPHMGRAWTVLVRLLGNQAAVAEGVRRVRSISTRTGIACSEPLPAGDVWGVLALEEANAVRTLRLAGRVGDLDERMDFAARTEGLMVAAHAADGAVRVWTGTDDAGDALGAALRAARELGWAVREDRVRQPAPDAPGTRATSSGPAPVRLQAREAAVERIEGALRAAFDPASILLEGGREE